MEKRTEREDGLPFPDSNGGMDLCGRRTQFGFDWGFCDTDINEVTRTRPVLRTRKKKEIARRRRRSSFLSFDAATRPRTKAVPIRKEGDSAGSPAERRCSSIMAEACSPLLLLATLNLAIALHLSASITGGTVPFTNSPLARARHSLLPRHDPSVISPHVHLPHSSSRKDLT